MENKSLTYLQINDSILIYVIDCCKISPSGDFVEDVHREQEASKFFGRLIGRNSVENNKKREFTTGDIVNEGYLYKKGSWLKNWSVLCCWHNYS